MIEIHLPGAILRNEEPSSDSAVDDNSRRSSGMPKSDSGDIPSDTTSTRSKVTTPEDIEQPSPSALEFLDYHRLLMSCFEARKQSGSGLSYRTMAEKLGLDTSNLFRILKGTAHLPARCHSRAIGFLGLSGIEAEYFLLLIAHGREKNAKIKSEVLERILEMRRHASETVRAPHSELASRCGEDFDRAGGVRAIESLLESGLRGELPVAIEAIDSATLRDIQEILDECRRRIRTRVEASRKSTRPFRATLATATTPSRTALAGAF